MNQKEGLDFFPMKCATDENIRLVTAEFGLKAKAVIVELLQKIYREHGYYCEWNREVALLFSLDIGEGYSAVNRLNEIVLCCTRRGVFSRKQFEENGILTSREIQENFFNATKRRKCVKVKKAYLLVEVALFSENVNIIDENVNILNENADILKQSRVEDITNYLSIVPTFQEVKDYVAQYNMKISPEKFFKYYDRVDWKDKYGRQINWKKAADYWNKTERPEKPSVDKSNAKPKYSGNKKNQFNKFGQRNVSSSDMDELEKRLLKRG